MRAATVRRLSLRVPQGRLAACRQRAEDALHLAAPDETRLLILRRLALGRIAAGAGVAVWTERASQALAERRARAVHGGQPGAEAADAVWFRSAEEARTLLLLLLASGRHPGAWFWQLAVPDWGGARLDIWLADWVHAAERDDASLVTLARAVIAAIADLGSSAIMVALAAALPPRHPERAADPARNSPVAVPSAAQLREQATMLLARHGTPTQLALANAVVAMPAGDRAPVRLAEYALVAAAPELAVHRAHVAVLGRVLAETLREAFPRPLPGRRIPASAAAYEPDADAAIMLRPLDPPRMAEPVVPAAATPDPRPGRSEKVAAPQPVPASAREDAPPPPADAVPVAEQLSRGAGVLLAIRALDRMGLGVRLAGDAEAAAAGFGRQLLCRIAQRARLPPGDPLFALLDPPAVEIDPGVLDAWRIGLDRWLRRRARIRLADLAGRHGWLQLADTTLLVRFPLRTAELRLRRQALDVDPGWVGWLGLSVRYVYSDSAPA